MRGRERRGQEAVDAAASHNRFPVSLINVRLIEARQTLTNNKMIAVYLKDDMGYVLPQAGVLAYHWEIEPVFRAQISAGELPRTLGDALRAAPYEGDPRFARDNNRKQDPLLKATGVRSRAAFERGAKFFNVTVYNDRTIVRRYRPEPQRGEGYTRDSWEAILPGSATPAEIANVILEAAPTALSRPVRRAKEAHAGALTLDDLPVHVANYVPEFLGDTSAKIYGRGRDPDWADRLMAHLLEFVQDLPDDAGEPRTTSNEILRRVMALIEYLLREGDNTVCDVVLDSFVESNTIRQRQIRKLAGSRTRSAIKNLATLK